MTSSMLAGEKRWASTRSRGMTVLGKVAVPKPLNLPSQRLENHGLDPNVEIVPKGTLSWGSRSSASASNAWGSSTLSPNTDGGTSSPSHLSGRPSSGSGTRPSTAGSDRTHEPIPNAWGQSSRPSSASGAVTSNQSALTSLRPRSAETRPGSSHLSRFAELSSDNSVAWGPTGVSEKLGGGSSKNDGFSLSSGDFPTLGSERDNPGKNSDTQDHGSCGRPGSSSGRVVAGKEKTITSSVGLCTFSDNPVNADVKSGTVSTWKRDNPQLGEDGVQPTVEKWQGDAPPFLNANVPPQHFDAWHGPPMNPPPGVWYRGPPGGPPYAPPLGPGGFPIEPFPYYRPQIPPAALANSQPVLPPGAGPRGHHPKNGDLYRPHMPDAYIRPGMPIRPGFYPGPVAYEGYYGPPMGYCNSSDRDIPFMGIAAGPSVYNKYPGDNAPDPSNSHHARGGPHGPTVKTPASERVESGHLDDTQGQYKVLLKQHSEWDEKQGEDRWEHAAPANIPYVGKGDHQKPFSRKDEWGLEEGKDEENYSGRRILGGDASRNFDNRENSVDSVKVKLPANKGKGKAVNESLGNRSESSVSAFSQASQMFPSAAKDPTLIQKIEGLNAKIRASDGQPDTAPLLSRDEQKNRLQVGDAKASSFTNESGTDLCSEKTHAGGNVIPCSHEVDIAIAAGKTLQLAASGSSATAVSRKTNHGVQSRLDNRGKRFNSQDGDGWRKKSHAVESTSVIAGANSEPSSTVHGHDCLPSAEAADKCGTNIQGKDEGESSTPMFDPSDGQAQRVKMKEIAKQRALQLRKEEEERSREQKAKALAKLEELNRRTQVVDGSIQKLEKAPPSGPIQQEQEQERKTPAEQEVSKSKSETPTLASISTPNAPITESSCILVGEYNILSRDTLLETSDNAQHGHSSHGQSLPLQKDDYGSSTADHEAASLVNEGSVPKHKRMGYKQKQSTSQAKNLNEKSVPVGPPAVPKANADVAVIDVASTEVAIELGPSCEPSLPVSSNVVADPSAHQRRKSNKSSKNKHKLDDVSPATALPSAVPKEINSEKSSTESAKPITPELDPCLVKAITDGKQVIQPSEQFLSLPSEEPVGRGNSQWKHQHSRRVSRNQLVNRPADKLHGTDALIWAPVRSQSKADITTEVSDRTVNDTVILAAKSDTVAQNNLKSKRAEMERYVAKGSVQSSVSQTPSDSAGVRIESLQNIEGSQRGESATGKNGDDRQNKQSKTHGSWRQKGLVESDLGRNIQNEKYKPDMKSSDDSNTRDGWYNSENSETLPPVMSTLVKDQAVVVGRGKRNPSRGHKSVGDSRENDHRNVTHGDMDKSSSQFPASEVALTDKSVASKVSQGPGERASQWQPKSQVYSVHSSQRGNKPVGGHNITAEAKDLPSEEVEKPPMDQQWSEQKSVAATANLGHQEFKRDRRLTSFRGRPLSPNQSSNTVEPPPAATGDSQNEQRFSSGFRKNGNQNSRLGKGHESRGDWTSSGQDNRQPPNTSSNRERQRHNSHYEYQPIGQYSSNKSNNEGPRDSSHGTGQQRYRERSQGQQRRGGSFYARQSGSAPVDGGYD
ncbi:hypothetical protein NMG60_11004474 [Bertholletia excelsa]